LGWLAEVNQDRRYEKLYEQSMLSYSINQSGAAAALAKRDRSTRTFHGSTLIRSHLYVWAVCQIAPIGKKVKSEIGELLSSRYQELRMTPLGKDALRADFICSYQVII
jgi:hypothetical protein